MKYKVSNREIRRVKKFPFSFSIPLLPLVLLILWLSPDNENFDVREMLIIVGVMALILVGIGIYVRKKYLEAYETMFLEIHTKGLSISSKDNTDTFLWSDISTVYLTGSESKIKRLSFKYNNSELFELSIYENLEMLNSELKMYLDEEIWNIRSMRLF